MQKKSRLACASLRACERSCRAPVLLTDLNSDLVRAVCYAVLMPFWHAALGFDADLPWAALQRVTCGLAGKPSPHDAKVSEPMVLTARRVARLN